MAVHFQEMLEDDPSHYPLIMQQSSDDIFCIETNGVSHMSIGIIGAGNIGAAFARILARNGIHATIANSRGPESLRELTSELSPWISAGTVEQAANADMVLVAVTWPQLPQALGTLPDWNGRIVLDANNSVGDLSGRFSSEVFEGLVPGARVVKAFNHLFAKLLASDPASEGGKRVLFYSGDDAAAKAEVAALIEKLGFFGIDLGTLAVGARLAQFPGGVLPALNLVKFG
jgi:predicted dinucleotide-binding enzyme